MTLAMLVVSIAAGHHWLPAVQQKRVFLAIGLAVLFLAGTFVCVTGSAGRGAEVAQPRQRLPVAPRTPERHCRLGGQGAHGSCNAHGHKECATGEGPKCRGARASVEYADSHIAILEVRRNDMAPEQEAIVQLRQRPECSPSLILAPTCGG